MWGSQRLSSAQLSMTSCSPSQNPTAMPAAYAAPSAVVSATFGRSLEYYTGFVFQVEAGDGVQVAGGGRYDDLLADMGAGLSVPAVGCAIHCDRLLALAREGKA